MNQNLIGWNFIVYTIIRNNFKFRSFKLDELYAFEKHFSLVYPSNYHVKAKIRQTLQYLRNKEMLEFQGRGQYKLYQTRKQEQVIYDNTRELVYLLSNESIPGWVKIGRTNSIERRLKELYNTSVPLPFKVEDEILTNTLEESSVLEKSIHSIIDTLNPDLRKNTDAYKREFFKMSPEEGKSIFKLVSRIMGISFVSNSIMEVQYKTY